MATFYKVVRVNRRGEYRSAVVNGKACLRYALGERTAGAEGMPVLVFDSEVAALQFSTAGEREAVLAGTAGNPRIQTKVSYLGCGIRGFRLFWQGKNRFYWEPAPDATCAADWFEPERVVQEKS